MSSGGLTALLMCILIRMYRTGSVTQAMNSQIFPVSSIHSTWSSAWMFTQHQPTDTSEASQPILCRDRAATVMAKGTPQLTQTTNHKIRKETDIYRVNKRVRENQPYQTKSLLQSLQITDSIKSLFFMKLKEYDSKGKIL